MAASAISTVSLVWLLPNSHGWAKHGPLLLHLKLRQQCRSNHPINFLNHNFGQLNSRVRMDRREPAFQTYQQIASVSDSKAQCSTLNT